MDDLSSPGSEISQTQKGRCFRWPAQGSDEERVSHAISTNNGVGTVRELRRVDAR